MNCDYMLLLFLGFAEKDSNRDDVGENVSQILKEVANYCKATSDQNYINEDNKKYISNFVTSGLINHGQKTSRRSGQYGPIPVTNENIDLIQIPELAILNLLSRDELSTLYRNNQAFHVPSNDPSAPRLIAVSARVLASILKAKNKLHNVIDYGVKGAENIFSGIHEVAGGIAEIIGDGAHGVLDFIV